MRNADWASGDTSATYPEVANLLPAPASRKFEGSGPARLLRVPERLHGLKGVEHHACRPGLQWYGLVGVGGGGGGSWRVRRGVGAVGWCWEAARVTRKHYASHKPFYNLNKPLNLDLYFKPCTQATPPKCRL